MKLAGYFSVPSVSHYLVLDPEYRTATHYWRADDGRIDTRTLTDGPLRLEPTNTPSSSRNSSRRREAALGDRRALAPRREERPGMKGAVAVNPSSAE